MRRPIRQSFLFALAFVTIADISLAQPYRHPETALIFPDQLAGMEKISFTDHEKEQPGLGVCVGYASYNGTAQICLYTLGMKSVPSDIEIPVLREHFEQVIGEVFNAGENGPYRNVKKLSENVTLMAATQTGPKALSASFSFIIERNGKEALSKAYLMGYKNHFLKLRYTYHRDMQLEGEKTLKQLLKELSVMIRGSHVPPMIKGNVEELEAQSNQKSTTEDVKDLQEFITRIEDYLALNPDWKNEAWMARAVAYKKLGDHDQLNAIISYSSGVKAKAAGKYPEALEHYEKAIRLDPEFPWAANNMAWMLSTCPDEKLRDGRRAVELSRWALKVPKAQVPDFINTLAAAYAAAGDFDAAVALCRKSIEMWPQDVFKKMLSCFLNRTLYIDEKRGTQKSDYISKEGYGKAKWGMSKLDIHDVFPNSVMQSNDMATAHQESDNGYRATMVFHFRYDMLYRVQVVATRISQTDIETNFIKEAAAGKCKLIRDQSTAGADQKNAVWESDETRIEIVYSRSKKEAEMDFVSKRYEKLSPATPGKGQSF